MKYIKSLRKVRKNYQVIETLNKYINEIWKTLINFNLPVSTDTETVVRAYITVILKCYKLKILIAKKPKIWLEHQLWKQMTGHVRTTIPKLSAWYGKQSVADLEKLHINLNLELDHILLYIVVLHAFWVVPQIYRIIALKCTSQEM